MTAMAAINPLDQQELNDIIAETAEEDRGRLMTICNDVIPNQIIFKERVILVTILRKTGHIDLHDEDLKEVRILENGNINGDDWSCSVDNDGCIIKLQIGDYWQGVRSTFVLPPIVIRLVMLQNLMVDYCRSLPVELSQMQNLHRLSLGQCSDLIDNFPVQMELRNLKYFRLHSTRIPESTSSPFFVWLKTRLPSLNDLGFVDYPREEETSKIFDFFLTVKEKRFKDNLRSICMDCCATENELAHFQPQFDTIVTKIRPRFPNLRSIKLPDNYIESIQPIVEKFKTAPTVLSSLRVLSLYDNPVLENIKDDPEERAATMSLLKNCNSIYNLGGDKEDYPADLEYELRINHAGRSIIEVGCDDNRSIPFSLWPTILERAYEKSHQIYEYSKNKEKDATGLYYLLREGPALICRPELGSGDGGVVDYDEKKNNSLKQKDPKKRKMLI
jgi:hypothetical protein